MNSSISNVELPFSAKTLKIQYLTLKNFLDFMSSRISHLNMIMFKLLHTLQ